MSRAPRPSPIGPLDLRATSTRIVSVRRSPSESAERTIPDAADHLRAGVRAPGLADEGAVAHLGQHGAQVFDVRRLVRADVRRRGERPRRRRRRDRRRRASASAHANEWKAEISMSSRRVMRSISDSRSKSMSSGRTRLAMAAARSAARSGCPPPGPAMPMRASMRLRLVLGHGVLERDVACREPHLFVAAFVARGRLRRAHAPRTDRGSRWAMAVPCDLFGERLAADPGRPSGGSSSRSPRRCRCG